MFIYVLVDIHVSLNFVLVNLDIFYFFYRINAEKEDGSLGWLLNDDHTSPNCRPKVMTFNGNPHLMFSLL